jgi:molybdopterin-guanine dinucleotide biosynthesis protein A
MKDLASLILAGGSGKRMGASKALLMHRGKTFIGYLEEQLKPLSRDIIISTADRQLRRYGTMQFSDLMENRGPLEGLRTCMSQTDFRHYLVCPVDMPCLNTPFLHFLLQMKGEEQVVLPLETASGLPPLLALVNRSILEELENWLEKGNRSWIDFLKQVSVKRVLLPKQYRTPRNVLFNINTPEAYQEWLQQANCS